MIGNSERSWTIKFADRLQAALSEAQPLREKAASLRVIVDQLEGEFLTLKKTNPPRPDNHRERLELAESKWKTALRKVRELDSKATTIENAVYDLKAVNPNRVVEQDMRTPLEIIEAIRAKDREATVALSRLESLIKSNGSLP